MLTFNYILHLVSKLQTFNTFTLYSHLTTTTTTTTINLISTSKLSFRNLTVEVDSHNDMTPMSRVVGLFKYEVKRLPINILVFIFFPT